MNGDAGTWRVMRHDEFAEWADEVLNESRQVYARDVMLPGDGPLVFMDHGQAELFRARARADELICPVPGCPSPTLTTRGPRSRRHHFMHRQAPEDPAHALAHRRRVAVRLLSEWAVAQHPDYEIEEDARVGEVTATLLVRSPTGHRLAIIYGALTISAPASTTRAWNASTPSTYRYATYLWSPVRRAGSVEIVHRENGMCSRDPHALICAAAG